MLTLLRSHEARRTWRRRGSALLAAALFTTAASAHAQCAILRHAAVAAVEGDAASDNADRAQVLRQDEPGTQADRDPAAALAQAALAELRYRYTDADRRYMPLANGTGWAARCALLGAGWAADTRGLPLRADSLFSRAVTLARAARDSFVVADAYVGMTIERAAKRGVPVGLALLDSADAWAPAAALPTRAEAAARRSLLYAVAGDPRARDEVRRGLVLARGAHDRRAEARLLRSLATALNSRGEATAALAVLDTVASLERAARDRSTLAETLLRAAEIHSSRGELGRVREMVTDARAEAAASQNEFALGAADLGVAVVALAVRDYPLADRYIGEARRVAEALHDTASLGPVMIDETELALARGELARARQIALTDRGWHHGLRDFGSELEDVRALIAAERRSGNFGAARRWLAVAEALATTLHAARGLEYDRGTLAFAAHDDAGAVRALSRYLAAVDTGSHATRRAAGELLAAALARQGKLADARDALLRAENELDAWRAGSSDPTLRAYAFEVWTHEGELGISPAAISIAALAAGGYAADAFALADRRRARELTDALLRAVALSTDAPSTAGRGSTGPRTPTHATPDAVRARLTDSATALLEYVTGANGSPTTLFVVTREGVRALALPSADSVAAPVERLRLLLQQGTAATTLETALGAQLLTPALAELPASVHQLLVVADGPLHWLPFAALRDAQGRYVVERYRISLIPSAAAALALRSQARPPAPHAGRILAVGASRPDPSDSLAPLPAAAEEARDVASFARAAVVRTDEAASAAFLRTAPLDSFELIHLAAHAVVDEQSADRTRLVLAASRGAPGTLDAGDLSRLRFDAALVVLSACRTAGGVLVEGEGVQGLTAPLLRAGARAVLATQWSTGDRSSARFVHEFYTSLARGVSAADALHDAQVNAIRRGEPPATWAAFALVGDPDARVTLRAPADRRLVAVAAVTALAGVLLAGVAVAARRRAVTARR